MNDERAWDRALVDAANQDALEFQSTHQPNVTTSNCPSIGAKINLGPSFTHAILWSYCVTVLHK